MCASLYNFPPSRAVPCDSARLIEGVKGVPDGADWYYGGGSGQEYGQWKMDHVIS